MLDSKVALEQLRLNNNNIKNTDILKAEATSKYEKALAAFEAVLLSNEGADKIMIDQLKIIKDNALKVKD